MFLTCACARTHSNMHVPFVNSNLFWNSLFVKNDSSFCFFFFFWFPECLSLLSHFLFSHSLHWISLEFLFLYFMKEGTTYLKKKMQGTIVCISLRNKVIFVIKDPCICIPMLCRACLLSFSSKPSEKEKCKSSLDFLLPIS